MSLLSISYSILISNSLIVLLLTTIILYYKWSFNYWKKKKIPHPKPMIPFGNLLTYSYTLPSMHSFLKITYDLMKAEGHKHCGLYFVSRPFYMPVNPEYVKAILTKDFVHFADRGLYYDEKEEPLGAHLLVLEGEQWRKMRTKFTPTFTGGKIKLMFGGLMSCAQKMLEVVQETDVHPIDIKEICACFTTDVIGTCVFGINCKSFDESDAEFRRHGRRLFKMSFSFVLKIILSSSFRKLAKLLQVKIVNAEATEFFMEVVKKTIKYREEHNVTRNDFIQLLMDLRKTDKGLSINEIAAQSFLFFAAGFETSSTTMTFCIYELAHNQDIQEKVRKEIEDVLDKYDGVLTYDSVLEMKYLDRVIDETLRKHPPVPNLPRICTMDYKLPDGENYIEAGTHIFVPVFALHRDAEYYPDPEKFDPERFTEENKSKRHPYAYLPFGEGPRICLGQRFGQLQVKIGLITLIRRYCFTPNSNTPYPMDYDKNSIFLTVKDPVWINTKRITT
ncbi:cytochrome p450 [Holotrichia oblita]|uniref:Cytochrome p450 n=1 Tax=Holotrichia oblita TaxID=644536 RepID=A0ACB9SIS0_HOLOL|nr:cytochrome p450 [Holotrichia oblita]